MKLDKFHYHEAVDRASMLSEMFEQSLLYHPVIDNNKKLSKKADKIMKHMAELYQMCAEVSAGR